MNAKQLIKALEKLDPDAPVEIVKETKYGKVVNTSRVRKVEQVTIDGKPFVVLNRILKYL
jgi:hypothetical protein